MPVYLDGIIINIKNIIICIISIITSIIINVINIIFRIVIKSKTLKFHFKIKDNIFKFKFYFYTKKKTRYLTRILFTRFGRQKSSVKMI